MCGIAGIFDVKKSKHLKRAALAKSLLSAIERRGRHATGYAYHGNDGATVLCKVDLPASEFVEVAPMFTEPFKNRPRSILLHTRYATQGSPENNENNHPIYSKTTGLTLIHNGWLTNERAIIAKYNLRKDAQVDSETVLRLIEHFVVNDRRRVVTAIRLAMKELEGVFACALISEKYPDTLWLWRSGYPIACARDEESGALIFASTEELLKKALDEVGLRAELVALPNDRVVMLTAIKGELESNFGKLRKHRKPKKQKPIKNQLPLIGMPRQVQFTEEEKSLNASGWESWKKQGRQLKEDLER